ncbi:hypothetical protein CN481_05050 [Bacillus sp. AFS006103]|nr:hypothetical protein CN481_05050 [Bacillus sp. AFS006103]
MNLKGITLKKCVEYVDVKVKQKLREKSFGQGYPIKYMLYKENSPYLIVVFTSCPRVGIKSRYNYVRTLEQFKVNKLFILDEYGEDGRGCYYLGHNKDFTIRDNTTQLIKTIQKNLGTKHTVFCGSSKGGWAALNFGLDEKNSNIIAGAPQYLLGNYFLAVPEVRLEKYVCGENWNQDDIDMLNSLISRKMKASDKSSKIYLHYSDQEHTYKDDVQYLVKDLEELQYQFEEEVKHYTNHGDISLYFPKYLKDCVKNIISVKK